MRAKYSWQHIGGAGMDIAKDSSLAVIFEGYMGKGGSLQALQHQFQAAGVNQHEVSNDWPEDNFADRNRQCRPQLQYPLGAYSEAPSIGHVHHPVHTHAHAHPNPQLQPHSLPPASTESTQLLESTLGLIDQHEWRISFTTPKTWVPWTRRATASNCSVIVRVNQLVLKKFLLNVVPRIAEEQKAREQVEAMKTEDGSSGGRGRAPSNYSAPPATRTEVMVQDPQARTHMLAERRRRVRENEHYAALRALIPPTSRMDKATVLGEVIQLVKRLKKRVRQLMKVNPAQTVTDEYCKANQSAFSTSDHSPGTFAANSQGSERDKDQIGSPAAAVPPQLQLKEDPSEVSEAMEDESTSDVAPNVGQALAIRVPRQFVKEEDDQKEIVEVLMMSGEAQNQLKAEIRTSNQGPDMIIHILICFKELSLKVMSIYVTTNNDWIHANFQLKMSEDQSCRSSPFCKEVQGALETTISQVPQEFNIESNSHATLQSNQALTLPNTCAQVKGKPHSI